MNESGKLIFATRPSQLARWQTSYVIRLLQEAMPGLICEEVVITTRGDKVLDKPLPEIGGKGLFTQELEEELLSGSVDVAVHSLKDLPVEDSPGLTVGAIPVREDPRDVLVCPDGHSLFSLPPGAVVGTSSLRRQAQILRHRPDLKVKSIRGNVETRIRKVQEGQYDAAVMAGAGITRLSLNEHIAAWFSYDEMLPAPGQGALGIQSRVNDDRVRTLLSKINHLDTAAAVRAERAFLLALGGGCSLPVGAYGRVEDGEIALSGLVASPDGGQIIEVSGRGKSAQALGEQLAAQAAAQGAREVLHG